MMAVNQAQVSIVSERKIEMSRSLLSCVSLLLLVLVLGSPVSAQSTEAPLTNLSVIKLVKAGFKEKTVIAIINSRSNQFRLGTEDLIELKHNGVSENIILTMLAQHVSSTASDDWDDDDFLATPGGPTSQQGSSGAEIFGSSGGSRSRTRSRGMSGGNQNEGNITGSATVRIIRPPSEPGDSSARLERTPALNNEEIIQMVAAGFSEGTIIKRIDNSPANFDLSEPGIEYLKKNRVTDLIITAMSAAMGDSEGARPKPPLQ